MYKIFGNSFVTICAASSRSCQDRFLLERKARPALQVRCRSTARSYPDSSYSLALLPENSVGIMHTYQREWMADLERHSKWYSRGWVYQEFSMSSRRLIFTEDTIHFICEEFHACEDGWQSSTAPEQGIAQHPLSQFASAVGGFSSKEFTKETDRLPAIAGLARRTADLTGSEYLAGLFKDALPTALLFCKARGSTLQPFHERLHRLSEPGSTSRPSWSWAGLPGGSLYHHPTMHTWENVLDFEMIEAFVARRDETAFGRVKGGYLKIRVGMMSLRDLVDSDEDAAKAIVKDGIFKCHDEWVSAVWDTDNSKAEDVIINNVSLLRIAAVSSAFTGLLVYPAVEDGEFYRVGLWRADQEKAKCAIWETATITLV